MTSPKKLYTQPLPYSSLDCASRPPQSKKGFGVHEPKFDKRVETRHVLPRQARLISASCANTGSSHVTTSLTLAHSSFSPPSSYLARNSQNLLFTRLRQPQDLKYTGIRCIGNGSGYTYRIRQRPACAKLQPYLIARLPLRASRSGLLPYIWGTPASHTCTPSSSSHSLSFTH